MTDDPRQRAAESPAPPVRAAPGVGAPGERHGRRGTDRPPGTAGSGNYDALVIGSGLGGAFAAHALTGAGARVLLLERGRWAHRDADDWNPRRILIESRYRGSSLLVRQEAGPGEKLPASPEELPVNEVVGGKSVFYGAASLRFRPSDFDRWPISYEDLEPWYAEAERLLGVHGTAGADPVEPPRSGPYPYASPPLSAPAKRIEDAGRRLGFRPFPLPLAINFTGDRAPQCVRCDTCDGFPCRVEAKNDAAGLLRAAAAGGLLTIVPGAAVRRLRVGRGRITGVEGVVREEGSPEGREETWSAPLVVLAAGAIGTPAILLRSGLDRPGVGRFLMRHCNAVVSGLFPFPTNPERVFHKQVCFTDGYEDRPDSYAAGVVQDIYTPAPEVVRHFAGGATRLLLPGPVIARLQNLICITEDEAQEQNRVALTGETDALEMERVEVRHRYRESDRVRLRRLTGRARRILRAAGALATRVWPIRSFSHAVGTARMAANPEDGPLDPDGRFRGLDNLFVTDGAAFPSSAGVNPSLTIAANALRIASKIAARR